ncbi:MAG: DnaJ domain-containing protein [Myxococcota bacterium]
MSVDFAEERSGELGKKVFVADLLGGALQRTFSGTLTLKRDDERLVIEVEKGRPSVVVGGEGDRLGEVLVRGGQLRQSDLGRALDRQGEGEDRPTLGAILIQDAGLDPDDVKRAIQKQTSARLGAALAWTSGDWSVQPGASADRRGIGVPLETMSFLLEHFPKHVSDAELKTFTRGLLGRAVCLRPGGAGAVGQSAKGLAAKLVAYLEKPRKPDQLERAVSDRRGVRVLLKLLELNGRLELVHMNKAVPIPKATLLKGQAMVSFVVPSGAPAEPAQEDPSEEPESTPAEPPPPSISPATRKLLKEIDEIHDKLSKLDHFEVLGVKREAEGEEIRDAFRTLIGKYHPDALGSGVSEEQATKARSVAARINEAHQVLSRETSRAEYVAMLADDRIKGDARKAELVRDAELKSQMGVVMLRKRNFVEARKLFKEAMTKDEVTVLYKAQFAHAMHADARFNRQEAFDQGYPLMLEALKGLGDSSAEINLWAGQMLKEQERLKDALHYFKQALRLDSRSAEAKTEVRLLQSRLERESTVKKDSGGLSKFFKR